MIETIKELNLIPKVIRADRKIENVTICSIYGFFLRNGTDNHLKDKSFIYAHSTVNERMESSQLIIFFIRNSFISNCTRFYKIIKQLQYWLIFGNSTDKQLIPFLSMNKKIIACTNL